MCIYFYNNLSKIIDPAHDFETVLNDVQLGYTEGLSTRYRGFMGDDLLARVHPHAFLKILYLPDVAIQKVQDTRSYPWPEFVNRWDGEAPFSSLDMTRERNGKKVFIWKVKGESWSEILTWLRDCIGRIKLCPW